MVTKTFVSAVLVGCGLWIGWHVWRGIRQRRGFRFIKAYAFPPPLRRKLLERYPHLDDKQVDQVFHGLRMYFEMILLYGRQLAMPSRAVDSVWHDFLLFSVEYQRFCKKAFGRFLHHIPFETIYSPRQIRMFLERVWLRSCDRENIDRVFPDRLPFLFALDSKLQIPDGFEHPLDNDYYLAPIQDIAPSLLCSRIRTKLEGQSDGPRRDEDVAMLARRIQQCLSRTWWCSRYSTDQLEKLFDAIARHHDLAVAIFGDINMAEAQRDEIRLKLEKEQKEQKAGGSCGGGCCGGCCGGSSSSGVAI